MKSTGNEGLRLGLLVAILLLAFGIRLYRLGSDSLWYDETVSVHLASKDLPALVAHTAGDIHPPGYYLLLHGWARLAGGGELASAFLSLFFGMLLVALAYRLAALLFETRAGLIAALLVALSPYNLWFSQEVRMYTLGAVLGVVLLFTVIRVLTTTRPGTLSHWSYLAVYAVTGALGLWMLYYFAFLLLAINLMVVAWWLVSLRREPRGWAWLGRWLLAQGAVLLMYAPWIPVAWRQASSPPVPPWRSTTGLGTIIVETWSALSLGQSVEPAKVWPVLVWVAVLFGLGLLYRQGVKRHHPPHPALTWLLAGFVFLPLVLIYLASFITPLYHVRYAFTYSTPFYVLLGAGVASLWRKWRPVLWLGLAILVLFSGISMVAYHTDPQYASDDHRAATRLLAERWRPGDAILVNAGYVYTALLTYWDGDPITGRGRLVGDYGATAGEGPALVQTGTLDGDPSLGWGKPESDFYSMSRGETQDALERLFADFDRVWVYRIYDTVTDPNGFIRGWFEEQGTQFEDRVFAGESQLRVQGFLTGRDPLANVDQHRDAGLADGSLQLAASTVEQTAVEVGNALDLELVWRVGFPLNDDAILFAGLFDEDGARWAQADQRPLGPLFPVTNWAQGDTIRTPLRVPVPAGTPPGYYRLEVGWYRFVNGQPVWLPWSTGDRLVLGDVEVIASNDWWSVPKPAVAQPIDVSIGTGVQLLGFDAPTLEGYPGDSLEIELVWQADENAPDPGQAVLELKDDAGTLFLEASSPPASGRLPFTALEAGQAVRDPRTVNLPLEAAPGSYNLSIGRRDPEGNWLTVRRGPFPLGPHYPLATIRVKGRAAEMTLPDVQHSAGARFGDAVRLVGYDLKGGASDFELVLHWQVLEPPTVRYKVFVHLIGDGGTSDIRAQADIQPHVPSTSWMQGEFLADRATLKLPEHLDRASHMLLVGLYDELTGERLPVFDADGAQTGDSLALKLAGLRQ